MSKFGSFTINTGHLISITPEGLEMTRKLIYRDRTGADLAYVLEHGHKQPTPAPRLCACLIKSLIISLTMIVIAPHSNPTYTCALTGHLVGLQVSGIQNGSGFSQYMSLLCACPENVYGPKDAHFIVTTCN